MTNNERILSMLGFKPPVNSVEGALLDVGIDPAGTYVSSNLAVLKKVAIQIMEVLLTSANTVSETGYSITYDRTAVLARIKLFKQELGIDDDARPFIKAINKW